MGGCYGGEGECAYYLGGTHSGRDFGLGWVGTVGWVVGWVVGWLIVCVTFVLDVAKSV